MIPWLRLLSRLIVRPLLHDRGRTALTLAAVSLGVGVVVAIELAAEASAGSFRSSIESLTSDADLEITAVGGFDERLLGELATLPHSLRLSPRVEGYLDLLETGRTVPVFGVDLIGDPSLRGPDTVEGDFTYEDIDAPNAAWVGSALAGKPGRRLPVRIHGKTSELAIQGVFTGDGFRATSSEDVVVMDLPAAQRALNKRGRLDRIQVWLPTHAANPAEAALRAALPETVDIRPTGSSDATNRKMLAAFRWNLTVLSYLSLVVGAFLIYNTVTVSVVRRRAEIGALRALGAGRRWILGAFLAEAALIGGAGAIIGLFVGLLLAKGAVELMSATVTALYVTSAPGPIGLDWRIAVVAMTAGLGTALLSAWLPAAEASRISPTEAMRRGGREHRIRVHTKVRAAWAAAFFALAYGLSLLPPLGGRPIMGYLSALLLLGGGALIASGAIRRFARTTQSIARSLLGITGFLGVRSIDVAVARTSILVGALTAAVAMLVGVGVLVGSFRETVVLWMNNQVQADLYVRPAGQPAADQFPTLPAEVADAIEAIDGVAAVDRFRRYPISYRGQPAVLGAGDTTLHRSRGALSFLAGPAPRQILEEVVEQGQAIISEPFAERHGTGVGSVLSLPLGDSPAEFRVAGIFADYSTDRGMVMIDRKTLLERLPDPAISGAAIYLEPGLAPESVRDRVIEVAAGYDLFVATNGRLRAQAMEIFDRTFAITYALEAISIFVAVLGIAGGLAALAMDRRREFGLLRFLGAARRQIRSLVLVESGMLGLLSVALGAAVGAGLSLILIFVINKQSFGWTIQLHWPSGLLLAALTGVFLASIAAGLYPARVANSLNPIESLHEE